MRASPLGNLIGRSESLLALWLDIGHDALRLGKLCGNGPGIWIRLQGHYDTWHAARRYRNFLPELWFVLIDVVTTERELERCLSSILAN
jgi:hypothetical protein